MPYKQVWSEPLHEYSSIIFFLRRIPKLKIPPRLLARHGATLSAHVAFTKSAYRINGIFIVNSHVIEYQCSHV